ncbi:hypothetical protein KI387_028220, partial [Taxus chinensis]
VHIRRTLCPLLGQYSDDELGEEESKETKNTRISEPPLSGCATEQVVDFLADLQNHGLLDDNSEHKKGIAEDNINIEHKASDLANSVSTAASVVSASGYLDKEQEMLELKNGCHMDEQVKEAKGKAQQTDDQQNVEPNNELFPVNECLLVDGGMINSIPSEHTVDGDFANDEMKTCGVESVETYERT